MASAPYENSVSSIRYYLKWIVQHLTCGVFSFFLEWGSMRLLLRYGVASSLTEHYLTTWINLNQPESTELTRTVKDKSVGIYR